MTYNLYIKCSTGENYDHNLRDYKNDYSWQCKVGFPGIYKIRQTSFPLELEVPYLAEYIKNLAQSFDSKIHDSEKFLVR